MTVALQRPPRLEPGARIALVAPAGPLRDESDVERAVANVRGLGWEPIVGTNALARHGYLAGRDEDRLFDLQRAIDDEHVDAIWCLRGGYGTMRLLDTIDFSALRSRPKPLIGFSDITVLHAAIGREAQLVSFHGPTARGVLTEFSRDSLIRAVARGSDPCGHASHARSLAPGRETGRLVGGNLALLAALAGTPYEPDYDGAILVLEDVNESVFRVDRMLTQLRLSGALAQVGAIAFGAFTDAPDDDPSGFDALFDEVASRLGVPAIAGIPLGHIEEQWTIPLGAIAELDADARTLRVLDAT
jgi:muramoyltetrapeptide carboxypeptidase